MHLPVKGLAKIKDLLHKSFNPRAKCEQEGVSVTSPVLTTAITSNISKRFSFLFSGVSKSRPIHS